MMLSGEAGTEERIQALVAGADDYLTKPFSPRELAAHVKALLRRGGAHGGGEDLARYDVGRLAIDRLPHQVRIGGAPRRPTGAGDQVPVPLPRDPGRAYSRA